MQSDAGFSRGNAARGGHKPAESANISFMEAVEAITEIVNG